MSIKSILFLCLVVLATHALTAYTRQYPPNNTLADKTDTQRHGAEALGNSLSPVAGMVFRHPRIITTNDGEILEFDAGQLFVPESRSIETGNVIAIPYYRLKSTSKTPVAPIFLLAGGPGASWINRIREPVGYEEVLFYQKFADVVLFDQRGGGHARPYMFCSDRLDLPLDEVATTGVESRFVEKAQSIVRACRDHWQARGLYLSAYNTNENADDIDDLRVALGYKKINLIGGSYGSHLAFAVMKRHPKMLARVMLRGIEGPDHTYDLPSGVLAAMNRFAETVEASPAWQGHIPEGGFIRALQRVEARLERVPIDVTLKVGDKTYTVKIGKPDIQAVAQMGISGRDDRWARHILAMDNGDFTIAAQNAIESRLAPIILRVQTYMMDCASGVSLERAKRLADDPAIDILGNINARYAETCSAWQAPDLGEGFRALLVSDIPTLIFHGNWDTSTPLENAYEVIKGLKNGHLVTVEGGGHAVFDQLYDEWPLMQETVRGFLAGKEKNLPDRVVLPTPVLSGPQSAKN